MKLEAEGHRAITDPQSNDIHSAVSLLSLPDCTFLILSRSGTSYVQVMILDSNRLALECRDGGAEHHFRSTRDDFSTREVVEILEAYRRGEDSWWNENEWRRIDDVSARPDPWDRVSRLSAIAGILLIFDSAVALRGGDSDPIFGLETMEVLSIGFVALMVSAIIDLRRFRTMDPMRKSRAISIIGVAYWWWRSIGSSASRHGEGSPVGGGKAELRKFGTRRRTWLGRTCIRSCGKS